MGSDTTIITAKQWEHIKPQNPSIKLKSTKTVLHQFDRLCIKVKGELDGLVETDDKFLLATNLVANVTRDYGLIGNDILTFQTQVCNVRKKDNQQVQQLKMGKLNNMEAKIKLMDGAVPVFHLAWHLPIHIHNSVKEALEDLVKENILERVEGGCEWSSPIVVIRKSNGKLHICGDYKGMVNGQIVNDSYLAPNLEAVFSPMANTKIFAKINLSQAYLQIPLAKSSWDVMAN